MSDKKFATVINCMDGRVQDAIKKYMQDNYAVDFVDVITEPGPVKILAEATESSVLEDVKKCIGISVNKHNSKIIAIVGHYDCAGNPLSKEEQIKQLPLAKKTIESFGFNVEVMMLWVEGDWNTVEKI